MNNSVKLTQFDYQKWPHFLIQVFWHKNVVQLLKKNRDTFDYGMTYDLWQRLELTISNESFVVTQKKAAASSNTWSNNHILNFL